MLADRDIITDKISKYMNANRYTLSHKSKNYHALDSYVYEYVNCGGVKDNIKIEINYMLRCHVLPVARREVKLPWNEEKLTVLSVAPLEIFASKTVALLTRTAPRDLYDMYNMVKYGLFDESEEAMFRKCAAFYSAIGAECPPEKFELDNVGNVSKQQIKRDLCGRVIEALRIYREAIEINPSFGMALGNYGRALQFYANTVNDPGHYKELHCYAYQAVKCALKIQDVNMHDDAISYFEKMIEVYETQFDKEILSEPIVHKRYKLGKSDERKYRTWCLENHLFLNPLNDLINMETAFAHDPLTITHYTEGVNERNGDAKRSVEPPKWFAMLNQLKEEYIYSRFLCFDGSVKLGELHYADKEVKLSLASYDYVNYSIRLEELKSAFKNLFSIFDQIAFFINEFWKLNFKEHDADAEHVFKCECYPKDNVALLALYWSYCEFWERFGDAKSASERKLKNLRNALEHKYVKVHEYAYQGPFKIEDDRIYHISEDELRSCACK